jgi:hypothetical protein
MQVARVLCCVRDAITEPEQRLPCLAVGFVASALHIAARPQHPQYRLLHSVAEQSRAEQSRAEQSRAEQSRAEHSTR